jgi:hypothetical protein
MLAPLGGASHGVIRWARRSCFLEFDGATTSRFLGGGSVLTISSLLAVHIFPSAMPPSRPRPPPVAHVHMLAPPGGASQLVFRPRVRVLHYYVNVGILSPVGPSSPSTLKQSVHIKVCIIRLHFVLPVSHYV